MTMQITVTDYLEKLEEEEKERPVGVRRTLPTAQDIAEFLGRNDNKSAYKWLKTPTMNEKYFNALLTLLRQRGWEDADVPDLLSFEMDEA